MGQEKSVPAPNYYDRHFSHNPSTSTSHDQYVPSSSSTSHHQKSQQHRRSSDQPKEHQQAQLRADTEHQARTKQHHLNTSALLSNRKSTSSIASCATERSTHTTASSTGSDRSTKQQTKYLHEHLYIKSYLDIEEEKNRSRRVLSEQTRSGLRNYTPKILTLAPRNEEKEVDVWI